MAFKSFQASVPTKGISLKIVSCCRKGKRSYDDTYGISELGNIEENKRGYVSNDDNIHQSEDEPEGVQAVNTFSLREI